MKQNNVHLLFIVITIILSSCKINTDINTYDDSYVLDIPGWAPYPNIPLNNQLTKSRVGLGEKLFHDTRLSVDSTISCASCHIENASFTDNLDKSRGVFNRQITN